MAGTEEFSITGTTGSYGSASTDVFTFTGKMYFCTNASTPTWEKITST
jgi:hypothetical protein